jgi:hypothetical protein
MSESVAPFRPGVGSRFHPCRNAIEDDGTVEPGIETV